MFLVTQIFSDAVTAHGESVFSFCYPFLNLFVLPLDQGEMTAVILLDQGEMTALIHGITWISLLQAAGGFATSRDILGWQNWGWGVGRLCYSG